MDSFTVSGINTVCRLIVKTEGEPTVEGTTPGTITAKVSKSCRSGERAIFNIGIVKNSSATAGTRKITAVQRDTTFRADFTANALEACASYISVYALKVKETADYVVMKMGSDQSKELKWGKRNLGATTIAGNLGTCAGNYFAWGATELAYSSLSSKTFTFVASRPDSYGGSGWTQSDGFKQVNAPYYDGSAYTKYTSTDSKTVLESGDDAATALLGSGWRMPTKEEFKALYDACGGTATPTAGGSTSTTEKGVYWCTSYDGVAGCLFCDGTNKLFFPAAGSGSGTSLSNAGSNGCYWSSSLCTSNTNGAYSLYFGNDVNPQRNSFRYCGFSVRPVSD